MNINKLRDQVSDFLKDLNYELYGIEFEKKKKNSILRIYIDGSKDITIDDCVFVNDKISPFLDEIDPIADPYLLEISSPGAEKELKTKAAIEHAIGKYVFIKTYEQKYEGELVDFAGDVLTIKVENKNIEVNYIDIKLIRLAIKF